DGLLAARCLTRDGDALLAFEQDAEAGADERLAIGHHHADGSGNGSSVAGLSVGVAVEEDQLAQLLVGFGGSRGGGSGGDRECHRSLLSWIVPDTGHSAGLAGDRPYPS